MSAVGIREFLVIEKPDDWEKAAKSKSPGTDDFYLKYWSEFLENIAGDSEFSDDDFKPYAIGAKAYLDCSVGFAGAHLFWRTTKQNGQFTVGLWINSRTESREIYNRLLLHKSEFDAATGLESKWSDKKVPYFHVVNRIDRDDREQQFKWLKETAVKLRDFTLKYGR